MPIGQLTKSHTVVKLGTQVCVDVRSRASWMYFRHAELKFQDTKATVDYRQPAAATADNAHSQQRHTGAKQNTQYTTAGKTTPVAYHTSPGQQHRRVCVLNCQDQ